MIKKICENNHFNMFEDQGLIICEYKVGLKMNVEIAENIVDERLKYCKGRSYPILADARNLVSIDSKARKFYATEKSLEGVSAGAIYIDNYLVRMLGNVWHKIEKPKVPSRLFTDKEKALEWLKTFL